MTINKSELMTRAWVNYKAANGYMSFSDSLKMAWREAKSAAELNIEELKKSFWTCWNLVKNSRTTMRSQYIEMFDDVCNKLSNFSRNELKEAFGKYSEFVLQKVA